MNNEQIIRRAYDLAERWTSKVGLTPHFRRDVYRHVGRRHVPWARRPHRLGKTVEVYAEAFPDMHRELYRFFSIGESSS